MIDSHCHLDFADFDGRRDQAVADAVTAGVHTIINIGIDLDTSQRSIELADQYANLYATVGIHPHEAKTTRKESIEDLRRMAAHPKVVAIGEIGLDFYRDHSPRADQRRVFRQQLELAVALDMPIVIHTRNSFGDTLDIVSEYAADLPGGVFHCFPGHTEDAYAVFDLGFVISVGGVITFKNSQMGRVAAEVPLGNILLETDAPFLAPVPHRGKTNYPAYVALTARKLAELRGVDVSEIEQVTDRNCRKLFGLVETFGG